MRLSLLMKESQIDRIFNDISLFETKNRIEAFFVDVLIEFKDDNPLLNFNYIQKISSLIDQKQNVMARLVGSVMTVSNKIPLTQVKVIDLVDIEEAHLSSIMNFKEFTLESLYNEYLILKGGSGE